MGENIKKMIQSGERYLGIHKKDFNIELLNKFRFSRKLNQYNCLKYKMQV